jgi:GTP cyclohydrolase I
MATKRSTAQAAQDSISRLLALLPEKVQKQQQAGLKDTPRRFVAAFLELTSGYKSNPRRILRPVFPDTIDEMIIVRDIRFASLCEHHLLPFVGKVHIGYLPQGAVVGLSKLPRLVDAFAKRLNLQERMTREIAEAVYLILAPKGVAVVVTARHSCMGIRGIERPESEMVTSCMLGVFRSNPAAREEFLRLIQ